MKIFKILAITFGTMTVLLFITALLFLIWGTNIEIAERLWKTSVATLILAWITGIIDGMEKYQ